MKRQAVNGAAVRRRDAGVATYGLEPGWLLPEDDAARRLALRTPRNIEKARFSEDAEKLRRMWE